MQSQNIFHSPLVFYSWDLITAVLQQHGLVERQGGPYYVSDLAGLIKLVEEARCLG